MINNMGKSVNYWLIPTARDNQIVGDSSPIDDISKRLSWLRKMWTARFDDLAMKLSMRFAREVRKNIDHSVKSSLKQVMSVKFEMTPAMSENVKSIVKGNVNLIKSIPEQYFSRIETITLESVTRGRDMQYLTEQLQNQLGVTRRRAEFIARDQNDKATSLLTRVRHKELGITKGKWLHSGGGKHPRPKHVAADGTIFDIDQGLPIGDKGQWVLPSEEINCRCVYKAVIEGFR